MTPAQLFALLDTEAVPASTYSSAGDLRQLASMGYG